MKFEIVNKKNIKRAGAVFLTLFLIFGGLKCADKILRNNAGFIKYGPFLKNKTNYDVLFFGSSKIYDAVFPMHLWKNYGITSYNMGMHGCPVIPNYGLLKMIPNSKKPKIAVLDVFLAEKEINTANQNQVHWMFDIWPFSIKKYFVMKEIFSKSETEVDIKEMLNPFSLYHSRWSEKNIKFGNLFNDTKNREMGAESRIGVEKPDNFKLIPKTEYHDEKNMYWLEQFIKYCIKNNIKPVLVFIPYPADVGQQRTANTAGIIAEKYNIPFLNLLNMGIVDFNTDCYDKKSHLNPSGAKKVTDYLGAYLSNEFNLADHRKEKKVAKKWNNWYEDYKLFQIENFEKQTELKNTLMLLNNSSFKSNVFLSGLYEFDSVEQALLDQVSSTCDIQFVPLNKNDNMDIVIELLDANTEKEICKSEFRMDSSRGLKKFDRKNNDEAIKKAKEKYKNTARFDIKNKGKKENGVRILKNTSKCKFESPNWCKTENGTWQKLETADLSIDFTFRCINDGKLEILFRGVDCKDQIGTRIPLKINLTKIEINNEEVISDEKVVWHDEYFGWSKNVKDGEIITVHAEWEPIK